MLYHHSTRTGGFERCEATRQNCTYGDSTHISAETYAMITEANERPQVSSDPMTAIFKSRAVILDTAVLPSAAATPLKHGSCVGVQYGRYDRQVIDQATAFLRDKFWASGDWAQKRSVFVNKHRRDGNEYHMTVLSPKETRMLRKAGHSISEVANNAPTSGGVFLGVGAARGAAPDGRASTAYYAIVANDAMQEYRASLGLASSDFHITLAFECPGDIHNVRKDFSTRIL